MADYLSFMGGIALSDTESTDSEKDLNIMNLTVQVLKFSKKRPRDIAPDEEELIEGSSLYIKRPRIPECPDIRKWILQSMTPPSF